MKSAARLFLVGLDAADKDLIELWSAEGALPNFRTLLEDSLTGDIVNPRGLEAGSVWPSFYFGLLPGRTGQFDGARLFDPVLYDHVSYHPETDRVPPVWTTLSRAGRTCGVIDVPYHHPVNGIDGIKVVDRASHVPAGGGDFLQLRTHPPGLAAEIERRFGPDPAGGRSSDFFPVDTPAQVRRFRDIYVERIRNKTDLLLHYWGEQAYDFFMTVFTEAHCAGHRCWHIHDPGHPDHDPALARAAGDPMKDIYMALDEALGRIIDATGGNTRVIVYLSHGMGPLRSGTRLLDRVLARLNGRPLRTNTGLAMDVARRIWRHIPESLRKPFIPARNRLSHDSFQPDREGRRYFEVFANDRTAGIRINVTGREARGMVQPGTEYEAVCDQLLVDLHALRNAETGEPLIREVLRTRDHYRGPYLDLLPDLLVTWNRSSPINAATSAKIGVVDTRGIARRRTGDHRILGRFFATGPGWSRRRLDRKVRVEDFAPTIAALLDVPLEQTDGRVIEALIPETARRWRPAADTPAVEAHS